jgi:ABC-2 type transport system ATP-binding protein
VLDTPQALKAKVGRDRVQIATDDDEAAIVALRERFDIEATIAEGMVTFGVPSGEEFVPRLFAEWDPAQPPISSVSVSRPSLDDDVFMSYTGTTIRDAEATQTDTRRNFARMMNR